MSYNISIVGYYRFTTYQDARRVRLVDGLIFETNILRVSPVKVAIVLFMDKYFSSVFELVMDKYFSSVVELVILYRKYSK